MAKYTEHLRLVKPEGNEYYNVEQFNQNSELIDKETKRLSEGLSNVQEGATKDKKGIVQFGTEEGKALEGMMLARLAGCVGYGGDIQESGVKDINYIYYDRNTRKMYKCLNQNSDVSANVANFIPLDNNSLLDRLENLNRKTKVLFYNGGYVIPNNTVSPQLEDWFYFSFGLGGSSGEDRIGFIIIKIFGSSDTYLQFQGVKLHYDSKNKTLKVINNGGNLYFVEQYSCLT